MLMAGVFFIDGGTLFFVTGIQGDRLFICSFATRFRCMWACGLNRLERYA